MKRHTAAAVFCAISLLFGGCGAVEVNERLFVRIMAICKSQGETRLTVLVNSTEGGDTQSGGFKALSGSGDGIAGAAEEITKQSGRELFFGSCELIVADEATLEDISALMSLTKSGVSIGCNIAFSPTPADMITAKDDSGELIGADVIAASFKNQLEKAGIKDSTLKSACEAANEGQTAPTDSSG